MMSSLKVAIFLAWKSIARGNIGVTLLTVLILVLVALNLAFVPGLLNGLVNSANGQLIANYSSDIVIGPRGRDVQINHINNFLRQIESIDTVAAATARMSMGATLKYKGDQGDERRVNCTVYGIMPERETKVFEIAHCLVEGGYLEPRDRAEILLGVQLAGIDDESVEFYVRSLRHVHAGDKVSVTFSNGVSKEYKVKGIFRTGFVSTDLQAYISALEFESIVPAMHDMATTIHVKLKKDNAPKEVIGRIGMLRDNLDFQTWKQNAGLVNSMTTSFGLINNILDIVNALVAGITIFIVTYVDVINRRRQVGILRAIGIKTYPVILSYLLRALFYVAVGLFLSWALFNWAIIPLEKNEPFYFPFGPVFLTADLTLLVRTAIMLSAISLVAAFIPVWLVMRVKIMDAIWR